MNKPDRLEPTEDYKPYSEKWVKEINKLPKSAIIALFQRCGYDKVLAEEKLKYTQQLYCNLLKNLGMDKSSADI